MERLKEEEENEEETGDDNVRFPAKGADYVVLPTSDQPHNADEARRKRRRKLMIIGGTVAAIIVLIVIVLCVVLLVLKKPGSKEEREDEPTPNPGPLPDIADRITCNLAGLNPTKGLCEESGCESRIIENSDGSTSTRCVYPEHSSYKVENKTKTDTKVQITLKLDGKSSREKRDAFPSNTGSDKEKSNSSDYTIGEEEEVKNLEKKALAVLPDFLYVVISNEGGRTLRIKVSASKPDDSEEDDIGPPTKRDLPNESFKLATADQGAPFYITVTRTSPEDEAEEEMILDTRGHPLIVSENLVQFAGLFGATEIFSNGKNITSGDSLMIWNTQDNSNLPYFYGSVGNENPRLFGVAMDAPAPMKISFGIRKSTAMMVESVQLGGDFNMLLFLGPSRRDVATQFIQAFGFPNRAPWWSLGTIVHQGQELSTEVLNYTQYKIDVFVPNSATGIPHDSQQIKAGIKYVDPLVQAENSNDPQIRTAEGDYFTGRLEKGRYPGSFRGYVDYTHPYTDYSDQETSIYMVKSPGYNLRNNYPLNREVMNCTDNVVNNSPFLALPDNHRPLYNNTICLDYIHTGEGFKGSSIAHRMIHNIYGTLQAKILHKYRSFDSDGGSILQMSDSVSLGAGQYTAKSIDVATREDLDKVIPLIIWYGNVGIHAVTRLASGITDKKMIMDYHKLNAFLLFTSGDEATLSQLEKSELAEIKDFVEAKYHLYPEWLSALHKASVSHGLPAIREMSFNFPDDLQVAGPDHQLQFMVGDKIVVAAGVLLRNETSVYLPTAQNETWYRRQNNLYQRVIPEKGIVRVDSDKDPSQLYYVRGGSVLMTSRLYDIDQMSGNPIETVKREYVEVTIFLSKKEEEIHEKFYLREQDDLLLEVAVSVASHSSGVRIIIEPSGSALEGSSSDQRTWNQIIIAGGGLQGKVSSVAMNGEIMQGYAYNYDITTWQTSPLKISEDTANNGTPTLHKRYDIMISYESKTS